MRVLWFEREQAGVHGTARLADHGSRRDDLDARPADRRRLVARP